MTADNNVTEYKPYRETCPDGSLMLNFHPGQSRAWRSTARFLAMLAGTQSGKTCFEPDWLYREIQERGEGDYLVGTATFPLLELKLLPEFLNLFINLLHLGKYHESKHIFQFGASKTRIIFFSATNPEGIESATARAAVLDEAGQKQFRAETWQAVQRRLSLSQGRALFGTTLYQLGWLKNEVYDRWAAGDAGYEVVQFDSTQNPAFPAAEFERARSVLPAWKFDMFYRGRYARPAGLIYDAFNEAFCKVRRFDIPKSWLIYSGHDFGAANPAAVFYAQDPDTGLFYAWREYLPGAGRSIAQHVEEFKRVTAGYHVLRRSGGSHQEDEIRQGYAAHGWPILEPKLSSVEAQIDRVYALHKLNKVMVFDDLRFYLDEKMSFSRELDADYQPTDRIEDEARFHLMAAERYILSDFTPETAVGGRPRTLRGW